jgi:hypothetical protein
MSVIRRSTDVSDATLVDGRFHHFDSASSAQSTNGSAPHRLGCLFQVADLVHGRGDVVDDVARLLGKPLHQIGVGGCEELVLLNQAGDGLNKGFDAVLGIIGKKLASSFSSGSQELAYKATQRCAPQLLPGVRT